MVRLDFSLATPDIYAKIIGCHISHGYRSDLSLIGIEHDLHETVRRRGFWIFKLAPSTFLLQDNRNVQIVKEIIQDVKQEYEKS